jgi:hypothetical protein
MGSAEISDRPRRATDAWNAHDPDGVASGYAEDADSKDVDLPEPLRGRQATRDAVPGYVAAFSDLLLIGTAKRRLDRSERQARRDLAARCPRAVPDEAALFTARGMLLNTSPSSRYRTTSGRSRSPRARRRARRTGRAFALRDYRHRRAFGLRTS